MPTSPAQTPRLRPGVWLLWYLSFTLPLVYLARVRPPGYASWLAIVSLGQLGVGGYLLWRCGPGRVVRSRWPEWYAILLLAALQLAEYLAVVHPLPANPNLPLVASAWLHYTVMVALPEEIWFRGLWFAAGRDRFRASVVAGSVLFGLYHAANGWSAVVTTAAVGFVLALARQRGASLLSLVLVHGAMDLLNRVLIPGTAWRFGPGLSPIVFALIVTALGLGLWNLPRAASDVTDT
jgi:membrane protease YdiL (CAAX protease family)